MRKGAIHQGSILKPLSVRVIKQLPEKTWLEIRLNEGKNREIRRLCEAYGVVVDKLKRVAIGGLSVENLPPGRFTLYTKRQILREIGLNERGEKVADGEFRSSKKSIRLKKPRGHSRKKAALTEKRMATDSSFSMFTKEHYQKTMVNLKKAKEEEKSK